MRSPIDYECSADCHCGNKLTVSTFSEEPQLGSAEQVKCRAHDALGIDFVVVIDGL